MVSHNITDDALTSNDVTIYDRMMSHDVTAWHNDVRWCTGAYTMYNVMSWHHCMMSHLIVWPHDITLHTAWPHDVTWHRCVMLWRHLVMSWRHVTSLMTSWRHVTLLMTSWRHLKIAWKVYEICECWGIFIMSYLCPGNLTANCHNLVKEPNHQDSGIKWLGKLPFNFSYILLERLAQVDTKRFIIWFIFPSPVCAWIWIWHDIWHFLGQNMKSFRQRWRI